MPLRGRHYVVIAILLVAVSLCYTTWRIYHLVDEVVPDAYAQWWTGSMLVEYMKEHDDRWPKSWDDLREEYAACVKQSGSAPWDFDDLRNRVEIDLRPTRVDYWTTKARLKSSGCEAATATPSKAQNRTMSSGNT